MRAPRELSQLGETLRYQKLVQKPGLNPQQIVDAIEEPAAAIGLDNTVLAVNTALKAHIEKSPSQSPLPASARAFNGPSLSALISKITSVSRPLYCVSGSKEHWRSTHYYPVLGKEGKVRCILIIERPQQSFQIQYQGLVKDALLRIVEIQYLALVGTATDGQLIERLSVTRLAIENMFTESQTGSIFSNIAQEERTALESIQTILTDLTSHQCLLQAAHSQKVKEIDVNVAIARSAAALRNLVWQKNVRLTIKECKKSPQIASKGNNIELMIFSLLKNAIEAADSNKHSKVAISCDVDNGYLQLHLEDDCGGIAPDVLDRAFEPFFSTQSYSAEKGLGLFAAGCITVESGGSIEIESDYGNGTTVTLGSPVSVNI